MQNCNVILACISAGLASAMTTGCLYLFPRICRTDLPTEEVVAARWRLQSAAVLGFMFAALFRSLDAGAIGLSAWAITLPAFFGWCLCCYVTALARGATRPTCFACALFVISGVLAVVLPRADLSASWSPTLGLLELSSALVFCTALALNCVEQAGLFWVLLSLTSAFGGIAACLCGAAGARTCSVFQCFDAVCRIFASLWALVAGWFYHLSLRTN